jgi:hypothetical protein
MAYGFNLLGAGGTGLPRKHVRDVCQDQPCRCALLCCFDYVVLIGVLQELL